MSRVAKVPRSLSGKHPIRSAAKSATSRTPKKGVISRPRGIPRGPDLIPAAVSSVVAGPMMRFISSPPGSKRIRFRIPYCGIGQWYNGVASQPAGSASGMLGQVNASSSGPYGLQGFGTLCWTPVRSFALVATTSLTHSTFDMVPDCSFLLLEGIAQTKYRFCAPVTVSYEPIVGITTNAVGFSLGYTTDPFHPAIGSNAYVLNAMPSIDGVALGENAMEFASWQPFSRSFPVDMERDYYTYLQSLASQDPPAPQLRDSAAFALTIVCNQSLSGTVGSPAFSRYGRLYIESEIEFTDMTPISSQTVIPDLMRSIGPLRGYKDDEKKSQPTDDDEESIVRVLTPFHLRTSEPAAPPSVRSKPAATAPLR